MQKHPDVPQWGLVITCYLDPVTGGWSWRSQIETPDGGTEAAPTSEWVRHQDRTWRMKNLLHQDLNLVEQWAAYQEAVS